MTPRVTLLLPVYNGERFLRETLGALLRQTYEAFTLVVCDNASTDGTAAIVREFRDPRLRLWEADAHMPLAQNFNRARSAVTGEYFAWCSYDESYEPGWLGAMVELLDREPRAFAALCKADSIDPDGRIHLAAAEQYKDSFWPPGEPCVFDPALQVRALQRGNYLVLTACLFRASATERIGPLNERLYAVCDWEYWLRGLFEGYSMVGTHRRLVHYRRHPHMTTRRSNADLTRFQQEFELLRWIAESGHARGLLPTPEPDYGLVRNTLLDEFASCLAAGERTAAARVLEFLRASLPRFRGSAPDRALGVALGLGRPAGVALRAAEGAYLHLLARARA